MFIGRALLQSRLSWLPFLSKTNFELLLQDTNFYQSPNYFLSIFGDGKNQKYSLKNLYHCFSPLALSLSFSISLSLSFSLSFSFSFFFSLFSSLSLLPLSHFLSLSFSIRILYPTLSLSFYLSLSLFISLFLSLRTCSDIRTIRLQSSTRHNYLFRHLCSVIAHLRFAFQLSDSRACLIGIVDVKPTKFIRWSFDEPTDCLMWWMTCVKISLGRTRNCRRWTRMCERKIVHASRCSMPLYSHRNHICQLFHLNQLAIDDLNRASRGSLGATRDLFVHQWFQLFSKFTYLFRIVTN